MSELPDGIEPAPIPEPRESALGIVVGSGPSGPRVLLGLRARTARFMPGNLAFPGGKLEPADDPDRPGFLARCASRELFEETGLRIDASAWEDVGDRTTPPFFPVRFRTRFFVAPLPEGASLPPSPPAPGEIETLAFESPAEILAAWEKGTVLVPPPLLPIFRAIEAERPATARALAEIVRAVNATEQPCPRIEFVPGIWAIPLRTRTLPPASCTNVWLPGGTRFLVVDPGSTEREEIERLLAVVAKRAATGDRPEAVALTHHHRDHVGGVAAVARALGVPVLAHAETLSRLGPLPGIATRALGDGERLDLAGMELVALHTPGHAPGHLAFFDPARGTLIAGDLVSGLSTILVGLDDGDMDLYLASLKRVAALPVRQVLPAHGPPLPPKALAATIAHREERERKVEAALSAEPRGLDAIAGDAYADTPDAPPFLRELQARAHLERLARRGRARRRDAFGRWSA